MHVGALLPRGARGQKVADIARGFMARLAEIHQINRVAHGHLRIPACPVIRNEAPPLDIRGEMIEMPCGEIACEVVSHSMGGLGPIMPGVWHWQGLHQMQLAAFLTQGRVVAHNERGDSVGRPSAPTLVSRATFAWNFAPWHILHMLAIVADHMNIGSASPAAMGGGSIRCDEVPVVFLDENVVLVGLVQRAAILDVHVVKTPPMEDQVASALEKVENDQPIGSARVSAIAQEAVKAESPAVRPDCGELPGTAGSKRRAGYRAIQNSEGERSAAVDIPAPERQSPLSGSCFIDEIVEIFSIR